jgi:hypothetical protein
VTKGHNLRVLPAQPAILPLSDTCHARAAHAPADLLTIRNDSRNNSPVFNDNLHQEHMHVLLERPGGLGDQGYFKPLHGAYGANW